MGGGEDGERERAGWDERGRGRGGGGRDRGERGKGLWERG